MNNMTHYGTFHGKVEGNADTTVIGFLRQTRSHWISQNGIKYRKTGIQVQKIPTWELDINSIKPLRNDELPIYTNKKGDAIPCPCCGGLLQVDLEYMADTFGQLWEKTPLKQWSVVCNECEQANPYNMLAKELASKCVKDN